MFLNRFFKSCVVMAKKGQAKKGNKEEVTKCSPIFCETEEGTT